MADNNLSEMLLEAAGHPPGINQQPPSSRRPPSKDSSYSDYDDYDSSDDDSDYDRYAATRKQPSQVPLKKRLDSADDDEHSSSSTSRQDDDDEQDDDRYDHDGDSDGDSFDSDLYKDENDRKKLAKMSELDREMILADRANKRVDKDMKISMKKKNEKPSQVFTSRQILSSLSGNMPRYDDRHGSTRLYVGHLASRTRSRDLEDIFSRYGRIRDVDMKRDFAFVEYKDPRDADDARYGLNGRNVDESRIVVEFAKGAPRGGGDKGDRDRDRGPPGGSRDFLGRGPPPGAGRCFNCGLDGHWARDCKAGDWKNKCYRCGEHGSYRKELSEQPQQNDS